jgi:PAS domain S-box-containing protein
MSAGVSAPESAHLVQFYEADAYLVDAVARFIGAGLKAGDAGVVIATRAHRECLEERLAASGFDPVGARARGRYLCLDAAETLERLMIDGRPDGERFNAVIGDVIASSAARGVTGRVRAFGEMVALLCADGNARAAIRLEKLWEELRLVRPFSLLCAYPMGTFHRETDGPLFLEICAAHSEVIPAESYTALDSTDERRRAIADLQQKARALAGEVVQRRRAEETRARLAAIVESSDDAIVGKTLEGVITSWNRGAERIFGYTAEEMIGQSILRLTPPERRNDVATILETIARGDRVEHFETERVRKDGTRIQVSLSVSPIRDADGRIIGASKIARDVSDRKRADAEREHLLALAQHARAEAESASRAKDEFLAMLGHELRNPLSAVRNAIVAARLDERRREPALEIARRQADQLARLVDDLLDVARITQGRIRLRKEPVYLAEIVARAVEVTRALVEDRGHRLSVSLASEDIRVDGDATRLEQVVVNLLNNAAKYTTRAGRIEVVVERQGDVAVLRVRDDGVGIGREMLGRVFDLFAQAEGALDRAQGGLGIGLTVVRRLVELHGGRVEALSDGPGKGAEFVVRLPALPVASEERRALRRLGDGATDVRVRVLIVEDNPDAADSLMMLLDLLGHDVRVVHDGLSALEAVTTKTPDVMLVDIGLPGIDGYELARRIRQRPDLAHVVLVALTGYGSEDDRQRAVEAGFDHHLVKPIDVDALQLLVARLGRDPESTGRVLLQ